MRGMVRKLRHLAGVLLGVFVFVTWIDLVGPQVHVVETVIGLALAVGSYGLVVFLTRTRKPTP